MSWVHHKQTPPPPPPTSSSTSAPPTSSQKSLIHHPTNSPIVQQRASAATLRHQNTSVPNSALLMTSPYSNKTNLATNTTMRINNNPYQQQQQQRQQQQQQQQSLMSLQQHPQRQHVTPTSPHLNNNSNNNANHVQSAFNNQQSSWQSHPVVPTAHNYLPSSKMMPQAPLSLPSGAPNNNWQQQQQLQQQQQSYQNANNMYQQNTTSPQQQQWSHHQPTHPQQSSTTTTYDNFYNQQATTNNAYHQQTPPQQKQQAAATYFQQQQPVAATMSQTNAVNFFDNTSNNNQSTGDGWGDWDWNDNSTSEAQAAANDVPQPQQQPTPAALSSQLALASEQQQIPPAVNDQVQQQHHQQQVYNSNIIADSFQQQNSDTWNWGSSADNEQHVAKESESHSPAVVDNEHTNDSWNWQSSENQQQIVNSAHSADKQNVHVANTKSSEAQATLAAAATNHVVSPPPPPTEFCSVPSVENHNYNTNTVVVAPPPPVAPASGATSTNIPNTVFVSQAKPVTLPSRQYASPPAGNTPVTEHPPDSALMPPQAFQNVEDMTASRPPNVVSPPLPPPVASVTPPIAAAALPSINAVPPPVALLNAAAGNPFKRSGVAQHHRATGLMTTVPATPAVFNMPPPPPADFANPGTVTLMEPENNELPSQENQEILSPPASTLQPPPTITLPNSATNLPPPNDERNQYLQTSHLSENSEEQQQPEADGLLPPPGLSRLVLGEPELEASQRMVTGTEAPVADNTANVADVMHLEERHADGEDTASENAVPVVSTAGQVPPPSSSSLNSDRNLYLVPGESIVNNQQRVVTGVELQEQREIEMDGENLEDQQQQQQHHHQTLSPEARNEPPVEGADDVNVAQQLPTPGQSLEVSETHHQATKPKDPNSVSSHNDDDSDERLLNDHAMNHSTAGSSKSRTKYDSERQTSSRRRDKRSDNRFDSDDYNNSEDGEYSSEREERERRERNGRRRNYREGSVRSDRGGIANDDDKRNRRYQHDKRDKYYYEEERSRGDRAKPDSKRSQRQRGYENESRYDTEESTRFDPRKEPSRRSLRHQDAERNRRSDRSDQGAEYDDYNRRSGYRHSKRSGENYESDRRDRRRGADDYDNTLERRRRSDKHRDPRYRDDPRYDPRDYEEYRKHSSRNARDSDLDKEGPGGPPRAGRMHHDPRHAAALYGYPSGGYYDPYTAYYYNQMARTNPQAYAEWYKKYYGQHAAAAAAAGVPQAVMPGVPSTGEAGLTAATNDGRESVHSGRSSAHNDLKDRYTHAYITQANEYHRHYHHHHQQQHQQHQVQQHQQHHQQMAYNQTLNSTMLDEDSLNQSTSLYGGIGGLSSAHSNTNLSQIHGGYYVTSSGLGTTSAAAMYYARSDYAESRSGALSVRDPDPTATEPQRLTPCKFINEHAVVSFGSGILVTVKPKYTSNGNISNIVKLLKFKPNDETRKLFKVFPGPLVRGLTHKKTVIEFCQEQIRLGPMENTIYAKQLISNNAEKYRGSYTLMWNLLILLLKQNGMVVGTDIAELLLKNQQQFPYQTSNSSLNNSSKSKSGSISPVEESYETQKESEVAVENNDGDSPSKERKSNENDEESEENSLAKSSVSTTLNDEEITEKFRNYLLYGNVNEALEWATDNNLWGHALFLASKLDRRSHANVMMKFANKLALNDPLQTLYQLMSGRTPSSVTCVQDEKWGDWRPHLSMILSNTSQKPELDRKAITTLGDSLFNRGDLYAAHFCYLMAQVGFGRYQEMATQETTLQQHLPKLVLLGSSHYKQFQEFAHNEAIIMTEIYEYACSLNDEKFSIVEFQPYKFLLAARLLDYGFHLKSLMYLEQISVHIARDSSKYDNSFIIKVYEMADRLKYYDPVLEKTIDDQQQQGTEDDGNTLNVSQQQMEEQKWLQNLRLLVQQYTVDYPSSTATNYEGQQQTPQEPNYSYQQQQIDQQFMEINKQFSELNLQYLTNADVQPPPQLYNPAQHHQSSLATTDLQPMSLDPYQLQSQSQPLQPDHSSNELPQPQTTETANGANNGQDPYHKQQLSYVQPDSQQQQHQDYTQNYYDPSQQQQQQQQNYHDGTVDGQVTAPSSYDYWPQQQQQTQAYGEENARPTISMPKSKNYDTDDDGGANNKQQGGARNDVKTGGNQQQQQQKNKDSKESKGNPSSNQNSGWFGGIWNKFSLKPKNQMILPDDKNPAIVWDPEKKKWVNTDGDENEEETFKPPPKMSDIMPQAQAQSLPQQNQSNVVPQMSSQPQNQQIPFMDPTQQQLQYVPASITNSAPSPNPMQQQSQTNAASNQSNSVPAKTPTLQSNMFKMQRNRTLKNAYVDVFNPSGAPVNKAAENILAPALPPATVPQGGFFVPGSGSVGGNDSNQDNNGYQPQQTQDAPQFYNPNQFGAGTGY